MALDSKFTKVPLASKKTHISTNGTTTPAPPLVKATTGIKSGLLLGRDQERNAKNFSPSNGSFTNDYVNINVLATNDFTRSVSGGTPSEIAINSRLVQVDQPLLPNASHTEQQLALKGLVSKRSAEFEKKAFLGGTLHPSNTISGKASTASPMRGQVVQQQPVLLHNIQPPTYGVARQGNEENLAARLHKTKSDSAVIMKPVVLQYTEQQDPPDYQNVQYQLEDATHRPPQHLHLRKQLSELQLKSSPRGSPGILGQEHISSRPSSVVQNTSNRSTPIQLTDNYRISPSILGPQGQQRQHQQIRGANSQLPLHNRVRVGENGGNSPSPSALLSSHQSRTPIINPDVSSHYQAVVQNQTSKQLGLSLSLQRPQTKSFQSAIENQFLQQYISKQQGQGQPGLGAVLNQHGMKVDTGSVFATTAASGSDKTYINVGQPLAVASKKGGVQWNPSVATPTTPTNTNHVNNSRSMAPSQKSNLAPAIPRSQMVKKSIEPSYCMVLQNQGEQNQAIYANYSELKSSDSQEGSTEEELYNSPPSPVSSSYSELRHAARGPLGAAVFQVNPQTMVLDTLYEPVSGQSAIKVPANFSINNGNNYDDYFGDCSKCRCRIIGEGTGCSAMGRLYHIQCFTCFNCQCSLQGKPFYALDGKVICCIHHVELGHY